MIGSLPHDVVRGTRRGRVVALSRCREPQSDACPVPGETRELYAHVRGMRRSLVSDRTQVSKAYFGCGSHFSGGFVQMDRTDRLPGEGP